MTGQKRRERILRTLGLMWLTSKRLADMECVSLRTIWRDIDALRKQGHQIASLTGYGGGYGLIPVRQKSSGAEENADVR